MGPAVHDDAGTLRHPRTRIADELAGVLRRHAAPCAFERFGTIFDRLSDARLVLLAEATHGSAALRRARAAITGRLIEQHFSRSSLCADWPDAARIDVYVRYFAPRPLY